MQRITLPKGHEWAYHCQFVVTWGGRIRELVKALERIGIQLITLDEVILRDIPAAIEDWKNRQTATDTIKTKNFNLIVLPRKYRLLTVLDRARKLYSPSI